MNIKRRLNNNRNNFRRTSGATRKPVEESKPEGVKRRQWIEFKKPILIGGAMLVVMGAVAWFIHTSEKSPTLDTTTTSLPWQSCLTKWPDGTLYPDLLPVPTGEYLLPSAAGELKSFLTPHGLNKIAIKAPFLIEKSEVTNKAFRQYVTFVDHLEAGVTKERLKSHIGLHWNKDESETSPIKGLSWDAAWDYADWLGQRTGCAYTLPSREQWGATVLLLNDSQKSTKKEHLMANESLRQLLWGVREWTSSPCTGGYYLVGEDDLVPLPEVRSATCMPALLSVAGFRVAIKATTHNMTN
ncbi:MAG: SUMF1/EgtB/PvdO family nonheme iron enzyme [Magnetococcales bacterium]|nr:SUMF1/EgtB/PvdO family nonheme iron enzyme [Magnetococcales bacterium]MBF0438531.1 SUMF1/EgtB/PvdO family nonheme iron enzyme [Magnetococcales bacterium]